MSAPERLATWPQIEASAPVMAATMRRYLQQVACSLRPGSVSGIELGLRAFAGFLLEAQPEVTTVAAVTRPTSRPTSPGWRPAPASASRG